MVCFAANPTPTMHADKRTAFEGILHMLLLPSISIYCHLWALNINIDLLDAYMFSAHECLYYLVVPLNAPFDSNSLSTAIKYGKLGFLCGKDEANTSLPKKEGYPTTITSFSWESWSASTKGSSIDCQSTGIPTDAFTFH